jgi:hypothetical protein
MHGSAILADDEEVNGIRTFKRKDFVVSLGAV